MRRVHGKLNLELYGDSAKLSGEIERLEKTILAVLHEGAANGLMEVAPEIQRMPEKHRYLTKHFHQFTGNTVSATTATVVKNQQVLDYFEDESDPIHALIQKGETVYLDNPVEGEPRDITGRKDMPGSAIYGFEVAKESANDSAKSINGVGIILSSGPDYTRNMKGTDKTALVDIWTNTCKELEAYARDSKFAWHIKKGIAQAINNYGK